jgi:hypothetical protein
MEPSDGAKERVSLYHLYIIDLLGNVPQIPLGVFRKLKKIGRIFLGS